MCVRVCMCARVHVCLCARVCMCMCVFEAGRGCVTHRKLGSGSSPRELGRELGRDPGVSGRAPAGGRGESLVLIKSSDEERLCLGAGDCC